MRLYAHFDTSDDIDTFLKEYTTEKVAVDDMQPLMLPAEAARIRAASAGFELFIIVSRNCLNAWTDTSRPASRQ